MYHAAKPHYNEHGHNELLVIIKSMQSLIAYALFQWEPWSYNEPNKGRFHALLATAKQLRLLLLHNFGNVRETGK